jgi:hypothetical protein
VRLLRVLHLAGVLPRCGRHVLRAVELAGLGAGSLLRGGAQGGRVGPHVGDVAVLVQPLRRAHGAFGVEAELATRLLLHRRGHERRVGLTGVRLFLDGTDGPGTAGQLGGQRAGAVLVEQQHIGTGLDRPGGRVEVAATGQPAALDGGQRRLERLTVRLGGGHGRVQAPVGAGAERHPLTFALHDDPGGHRLHATRGQLRHHLLPQHRRDLIAVQPVQDAPGLLGVDEVVVQRTGVLRGFPDGGRGDLVEDHPLDRDLGLEGLQQVPRDGLAFAVLVCRQVELVGTFEQGLELGDLCPLLRGDDVQRLEPVLGVDAKARPWLALVLRGHVRGAAGQVADMTDR